MSRRVLLSLVGLTLSIAAMLWGQPFSEPEPIRVTVTEVVVPVTVTDLNGRFVTGLTKDQFTLTDQGVPQEIKFFSAAQKQPAIVGFVLDLSSSMRIDWKTYQENAVEMVASLLTPDAKPDAKEDAPYRGYLIGAGTTAELLADTTHDPEQIISKLDKLTAGGGVALSDAIFLACTLRTQVPGEPLEPRRILIVFGSGLDTSAQHSLDEAIEIAQRNSVSIYAVSTGRDGLTSPGSKNLERLAAATGGHVEYPLQNTYDNTSGFLPHADNPGNRVFADGTGGYTNIIQTALFKSRQAILGEIQQQYILRFQPNTPGDENARHRLKVSVNLPTLLVRARSEYYSR